MALDRKALRDFVILYGAVQLIGTADASVRAYRQQMPTFHFESVLQVPQCPAEPRGPFGDPDLDDDGIASIVGRIGSTSTSTST
jgi:hypothetical protein